MSLKDAFALGQALEQIDNMKIELARYKAALEKIQDLDPCKDTDEGYNEWGEAACFRLARKEASDALKG